MPFVQQVRADSREGVLREHLSPTAIGASAVVPDAAEDPGFPDVSFVSGTHPPQLAHMPEGNGLQIDAGVSLGVHLRDQVGPEHGQRPLQGSAAA